MYNFSDYLIRWFNWCFNVKFIFTLKLLMSFIEFRVLLFIFSPMNSYLYYKVKCIIWFHIFLLKNKGKRKTNVIMDSLQNLIIAMTLCGVMHQKRSVSIRFLNENVSGLTPFVLIDVFNVIFWSLLIPKLYLSDEKLLNRNILEVYFLST